jgi:hypothetical protein
MSAVRSRRGARVRWWLGYKLGGECLYVCWESMVGGGMWRYRIWSEGGWPRFGSGCRRRDEVLS